MTGTSNFQNESRHSRDHDHTPFLKWFVIHRQVLAMVNLTDQIWSF